MRTYMAGLAILTCCITACNRSDADQGAQIMPPASGTNVSASLLQLTPASLPDCTPTNVLVSWNVESPEDVTNVHVLVENTGELFAEGGAVGRSETGSWARPGTTFVLQDGAAKTELARAVIAGPTCD